MVAAHLITMVQWDMSECLTSRSLTVCYVLDPPARSVTVGPLLVQFKRRAQKLNPAAAKVRLQAEVSSSWEVLSNQSFGFFRKQARPI